MKQTQPFRSSRIKRKKLLRLPLQTILIAAFVIPIVGAVGLAGYLSFKNGQRAVEDLAQQLMAEVSDRVQQQIHQYLSSAQIINQLNTNAIQTGQLNPQDPNALTQYFWQQRFLFDNVCGSAIFFGNPQGEFTGLGRNQRSHTWRIGRSGPSTQGRYYRYATNAQGQATQLLDKGNPFDPRMRPWYRAAQQAGTATWSQVYPDISQQDLKIALSQPVYDAAGRLQGVLGVDCLFSKIGDLLKHAQVGRSGSIFLMERSGALIASSTQSLPLNPQNLRVNALELTNSLIQRSTQVLQAQSGTLAAIDRAKLLTFKHNGKKYLLRVTPLTGEAGLDWLLVIVVPESDFMARIHANTDTTIWLCLAALSFAIAIGVLTARRVTRPIVLMSEASHKIAKGELDQSIAGSLIKEVKTLADAFNWMSQQLRASRQQLQDYARSLEAKVAERTQALELEIQQHQQTEAALQQGKEALRLTVEALRQSEAKFRSIVENVDDVIYILNPDGTFAYFSPSFVDALQYEADEFIGMHFTPMIHPDYVQLCVDAVQRLVETGQTVWGLEYLIKPKYGDWRWYISNISAVYDDVGQVLYCVGVARDVTQRKLIEEELRRAKEAADAASQAKSEFLANMSHELRSPLNAILGFAQLLQRSPILNPDQRENVDIIIRSGEHLLTLINNVLDLAKIEAGRTTLNETNFDLHQLLHDVEAMFQLRAREKQLQLVCDRDANLPRYIRTDSIKLRQVLINLLSNAVKFTQTGQVILRVAPEASPNPRETGLSTPAWHLRFEVEDTGMGIASDEIDHLFTAFAQTQAGKVQEGTGLGLAVSRRFVELMGGTITVHSQLQQGTIFSFDLWATAADAVDSSHPLQPPRLHIVGLEPDQSHYRILVVDDKFENRHLLIKLLAPLGFELREATDGKEAIAVWREWEPHLIWMDMRMPVMDGYEATKLIKATIQGQATAIIALTASALESQKAIVLSAGCDDFIRKPFRETEIFEAIQKHLGVRYLYAASPITHGQAEGERQPTTPTASLAEQLRSLPHSLVADLTPALQNVDLDALTILIAQINEIEPVLAAALQTYIDNFDYEQVLAAIQTMQ